MVMVTVIPPPSPAFGLNPCPTPGGRSYSCPLGSAIQVPDFDALALGANGWLTTSGFGGTTAGTGTTAQRPTTQSVPPLIRGMHYIDTTIGATIVYDGVTWRNEISGAGV